MHRVKPEVYLVGETSLNKNEVERYLREAYDDKGGGWYDENVGHLAPEACGSDLLTEVMGRLCYRSFAPGLNLNVKKIREGNDTYIANILKSKHGSVIEHGSTNWIIRDVSRVFTHELVRHRAGCAYSQESLRYVRLDDFGLWLPDDPVLERDDIVAFCEAKIKTDERFCSELSAKLGLDDPHKDFEYKKRWTSFVRRFAPQGMATTIGMTINFRALRHVIEMRTAQGAEVEIRLVFDMIAKEAKRRWPSLMQDFDRTPSGEWVTPNSKV